MGPDAMAALNGNAETAGLPPEFPGNSGREANGAGAYLAKEGTWKFFVRGELNVQNHVSGVILWRDDYVIPTERDRRYRPMLWAHRNEALNGPNGPAGMPLRIVLHPYDLGGSWGIHRTLTEADVPTNDWHRIITAPFLATSAAYKFGFETHYAGGLPNFSQRTWLLDLVQMEEITGADVEAFLAKLKPIIEAVDVNVGKVYTEEKFWQSAKVLEENGVLQLDVPGLFDDPTRLGQNVTRFWLMQPEITTLPLTNGSDEWRARVRLIGFYQWEKGDTQAAALRHAATEILGALSRKTTEFGDLCTGPNYMGYLADRPRWATPVEAGEIKGIGLKGHLVQIDVVFHEEVPH